MLRARATEATNVGGAGVIIENHGGDICETRLRGRYAGIMLNGRGRPFAIFPLELS